MINLDQFVKSAKERHLFPKEQNRVMVACSGGPDSLCLLYVLWACQEQLNLRLSVLTCDHGIRSESLEEALDVRHRVWGLGVPCALAELDVPGNLQPGESLEMAARRLRREAYVEAATDLGADQVALGHHADDQAETVLMKLCRGTGTRGFSGMEPVSRLTDQISLVRPFLEIRRSEIEATLKGWGIQAVEDPSNASSEHLRNRVRHEVLPMLTEINPGVVSHVTALAGDVNRLEAWVAEEAAKRLESCRSGKAIRLDVWREFPEPIRERILLGWLVERGGNPDAVSRPTWRQVFSGLAQPESQSRHWVLAGLSCRAENGLLVAGELEPMVAREFATVPSELSCEALERTIQVTEVDQVNLEEAAQQAWGGVLTAYVSMPASKGSFRMRSVQAGDRYRPLGMDGRSKVSDLMINRKLPARLRPVWPVITWDDEIVWIPGFRVAEAWKVTQTPCLQFTLESDAIDTFCG